MSFKKSIRKIIPVRASVFEKYKEDQRKHNQEMLKRLDGMMKRFDELNKQNAGLQESLEIARKEIWNAREDIRISRNTVREANWANVFHDTIVASEWFSNISLSPGRWAVGYQYLYVLYRVLDGFKPKSILEFGLGESTTVINAYAKAHEGVAHTVIEHDPSWIEFYSSKNEVADVTDIMQCDLELTRIPAVSHEVRVYQDCAQKLQERYPGRTYDFVSIDGPWGYDMPEAARIDALALIPDMLADSFVIMFDDYNRKGEKGTVELMKHGLDEASIEYATGEYEGEKATFVIASKDLAFLCSL